jgi:hypothetical protein
MKEKECYKNMKECPRYITCSCPICPLDFNWLQRVFIKGEKKCKMARKDLKKLGYIPQVKARTEMGKTQHRYWASHKEKSEKNLRKGSKGQAN